MTRDGKNVRIVCTDKLGDSPIIALIKYDEEYEDYNSYHENGTLCLGEESRNDLFFADDDKMIRKKFINALKECGFTHFNEKFTVQEALTWLEKQGEQKHTEWSEHQHKLLNYAISMTDDAEVKCFLESLRNKGQQDALKDLPKWKKDTEHLRGEGFIHYEKHNMTPQYADTNIEGRECYITLDERYA